MVRLFLELDWIAIAIGTIVYSLISGMWHRPFAFGKIWERAMGFVRPIGWIESNMYYVVPLISCFVSTSVLALMQLALDIKSIGDAAILGLILGFGLATTTTFTNAVIPIMKSPLKFASITGSAHFVAITIVSIVLFLIS